VGDSTGGAVATGGGVTSGGGALTTGVAVGGGRRGRGCDLRHGRRRRSGWLRLALVAHLTARGDLLLARRHLGLLVGGGGAAERGRDRRIGEVGLAQLVRRRVVGRGVARCSRLRAGCAGEDVGVAVTTARAGVALGAGRVPTSRAGGSGTSARSPRTCGTKTGTVPEVSATTASTFTAPSDAHQASSGPNSAARPPGTMRLAAHHVTAHELTRPHAPLRAGGQRRARIS
jgi:hypothetical protein